jgi:predicted nucleic acid-binding protein
MNFDKRIVIDTGTLVSAALRVDSIPGQAYAKALYEFEVCVSGATFAEIDRVMRWEKFNAYFGEGLRGRGDQERFNAKGNQHQSRLQPG